MKQVVADTNNSEQSAAHSQAVANAASAFHRLVEACKQKDLETIKLVLAARPELANQRDKQRRSLFHYVVIRLIKNNYEDADGEDDDAAAEGAAAADDHEGRGRAEGQGGDYKLDKDLERRSLACLAYLTDRCDPKLWWAQDLDGLSCLHLAVISSNVGLVKNLIFEHPYSIKYPLVCTLDNELHSPLHWAVITSQLDCVQLLIEFAGVKLAHEQDLNGATPLHYATQTNDYPKYRKQLRLMLSNCLENNNRPLMNANCKLKLEELEGEEKGRKVGGSNGRQVATGADKSDSPIKRQQTRKLSQMSSKNHQKGLEILEYLVKLPKINLECTDRDKRTPLLWAASSGNREALIILISNGANLASRDANSLGALHCAASHGFTDCLECLLDYRSPINSTKEDISLQVNQADNLNCTPLFYSVLSGNVDCVETLLDKGADADRQDAKGRTAAHFAALRGQLNALKVLQNRGANLWLANKQGDLPLHYAIRSGRQQVVGWLIENSPYERAVNAINNFGRSPIHLAVMKDNSQLVDYLIKLGANLNQLVKVRDKNSGENEQQRSSSSNNNNKQQTNRSYHYETALDMARKLNHRNCVKLLTDNKALAANQVISRRQFGLADRKLATEKRSSESGDNTLRSLFDLQSADAGSSPIGFETSSASSGSPMQNSSINQHPQQQQIPKLSRPRPDSLPQTDSTGSSALSQNSLTSVRGALPALASAADATCGSQQAAHSQAPTNSRPYKGGISYNNERMSASIKCKLYDRDSPHINMSTFPQSNSKRSSRRTAQSAPNESHAGQEIITNVNVYTSPCPLCCHHHQHQHLQQAGNQLDLECQHCCSAEAGEMMRQQQPVISAYRDNDDQSTDVSQVSDNCEPLNDKTAQMMRQSFDEEQQQRGELPPILVANAARQKQGMRTQGQATLRHHHLPPSQSHEQHLPVILSEREDRSTSAASLSSADSQFDGQAADQRRPVDITTSPVNQEPRFDRSQRVGSNFGGSTRADRYRGQVKSPVAEYIRAGPANSSPDQLQHRNQQLRERHSPFGQAQARQQQVMADYSQVRAKVNSHRDDQSAELFHRANFYNDQEFRSKSMSMLANGPETAENGATMTMSPAHQSGTRIRQLSVDSLEMASKIERSIWKYRQEAKLFEELQNLKRNQMRSGRANEALLVKRLIERFRAHLLDSNLIDLETYHGPYTYKSYERYLYNQLCKLSRSNGAKLARLVNDQRPEERRPTSDEDEPQNSPLPPAPLAADQQKPEGIEQPLEMDDDTKADLELREVMTKIAPGGEIINEDELKCHISDESSTTSSVALNPTANDEQIKPAKESAERAENSEQVSSVLTPKQSIDSTERELVQSLRETGEEFGADDEEKALVNKARELKDIIRRESISSVSSSRRSSLEIERERLQQLPLRVNSENNYQDHDCQDEERRSAKELIELEAKSLSSSIIVDALGNVSRACTPSRASIEARQASKEAKAQSVDDVAEDETDPLPVQPEPMSGRRRSVVNIGNKLEVIYHNVGIEIQPVDESPADELEEEEKEKVEVEDEEATERSSESASRQELVEELAGVDAAIEPSREEEMKPDDEVGLVAEDFRSVVAIEDEPKVGLAARRASSPVEHKRPSLDRISGDGDENELARNRSSSIASVEQVQTEKKVFNGYDLDEMRQSRNQHRRTISPLEPPKEGQERVSISSEMDASSKSNSDNPAGQVESQLSERAARRPADKSSSKRRPKLARRFRLVKRAEARKVKVPIEEVRSRWARIKADERRKRSQMMIDDRESCSYDHQLLVEKSEGVKNGAGDQENGQKNSAQIIPSKSQPNLHRPITTEDSNNQSNFILLYEINRDFLTAKRKQSELIGAKKTELKRKGAQVKGVNWCQKKVIRIVDVRALKRTLSLPESLIYSNDLLKRFNILKL